MAKVTSNLLVSGLSGMLGGTLVFKILRGKTIVAGRPRAPNVESEQQLQNRNKFKQGALWAKTILLDAQTKAYYSEQAKKLGLPNAHTAAIADYMRP
jgi:hypothetical protein